MGSEADVPPVFAVELGHQRLVGVPDEQDGRVEGFNLLLATLMGFDADRPPASPVVPLALEPCRDRASETWPVLMWTKTGERE